jgi:hypothetical protein
MAYSFVVSYIILYVMNLIPFLRLRIDEKSELEGLDASQMGEFAFEALTEKEAKWSLADIVGEAKDDGYGGIVSK